MKGTYWRWRWKSLAFLRNGMSAWSHSYCWGLSNILFYHHRTLKKTNSIFWRQRGEAVTTFVFAIHCSFSSVLFSLQAWNLRWPSWGLSWGKSGVWFLRQNSLPPKRTLSWGKHFQSRFFLRQPLVTSSSIYFLGVSAKICFANGVLSDRVLVSPTSSRKEAVGNNTSHEADPAKSATRLTVNKHMAQTSFPRRQAWRGKLYCLWIYIHTLYTCNTSVI